MFADFWSSINKIQGIGIKLQFYLAFAYILRSHEIASHVTSSSMRVLTSSKVVCSTFVLLNIFPFPVQNLSSCAPSSQICLLRRPTRLRKSFLRRNSKTRDKKTRNHLLANATLSSHAAHNNSRIKQPLPRRKSTYSPTQY